MHCFTRPIEPYVIPLDDERDAYRRLRINTPSVQTTHLTYA
jgi:hypothetical protein